MSVFYPTGHLSAIPQPSLDSQDHQRYIFCIARIARVSGQICREVVPKFVDVFAEMEEHMESVPYIPNYRPCFNTFFGHEAFHATYPA